MNLYIAHFMRQRRRLLMLSLLSFFAGTMLYAYVPGTVGVIPVPIYAGLLYALFIASASYMTTLIWPRIRHFTDAVAGSRLLLGVLALNAPDVAAALTASPFLLAALVVGFATVVIATAPLAYARALNGPEWLSDFAKAIAGWVDWIDGADLAPAVPARAANR